MDNESLSEGDFGKPLSRANSGRDGELYLDREGSNLIELAGDPWKMMLNMSGACLTLEREPVPPYPGPMDEYVPIASESKDETRRAENLSQQISRRLEAADAASPLRVTSRSVTNERLQGMVGEPVTTDMSETPYKVTRPNPVVEKADTPNVPGAWHNASGVASASLRPSAPLDFFDRRTFNDLTAELVDRLRLFGPADLEATPSGKLLKALNDPDTAEAKRAETGMWAAVKRGIARIRRDSTDGQLPQFREGAPRQEPGRSKDILNLAGLLGLVPAELTSTQLGGIRSGLDHKNDMIWGRAALATHYAALVGLQREASKHVEALKAPQSDHLRQKKTDPQTETVRGKHHNIEPTRNSRTMEEAAHAHVKRLAGARLTAGSAPTGVAFNSCVSKDMLPSDSRKVLHTPRPVDRGPCQRSIGIGR